MKKFIFLLFMFFFNNFSCFSCKLNNLNFNLNKINNNLFLYKNEFKNLNYSNILKIDELINLLFKNCYLKYLNIIRFNNLNNIFLVKNKNRNKIIKKIYLSNNYYLYFTKNDILNIFKQFNLKNGVYLNNISILNFKNYIKKFYFSKGIININFLIKKQIINNNLILKFYIDKKYNKYINRIYIFGNKFFTNKKIFSFLLTKKLNIYFKYLFDYLFIPRIFSKDINLIKKKYFNSGYIDFSFKNIFIKFNNKGLLNIYLYLNENNRYKIFDIFTFSDSLKNKRIIDKIKINFFNKNEYLNLKKIKFFIIKINKYFKKLGYLNIDNNIKYKNFLNNKLILYFNIKFNNIFYINKVLFIGNKYYKNNLLYKLIPNMKNLKYNEYLINKGLKNLFNTNFFKNINIIYKKNKLFYNKVDIIYKLIEKKMYKLNFSFSFNKKTKFNYNLIFYKRNIFNLYNKLLINIHKNISYKLINLSLIKLLNKFNTIKMINKFYFSKFLNNDLNYLNFKYSQKNNFIFYLNKILKYKISFNFINNKFCYIRPQFFILKYFNSIKKNININNLYFKWFIFNDFILENKLSLNNLDNNFFHKKGYYISLNTKIGISIWNNLYYKIFFIFHKYLSLFKNNNMILSFHFYLGYLNGLNKSNVPFYENFNIYKNVLRSFDLNNILPKIIFINSNNFKCNKNKYFCLFDNTLGSNSLMVLNTELNFSNLFIKNKLINKYINSYIFLDTGIIWDNRWIDNINFKKYNIDNYNQIFRVSYGISFKIKTPIGKLNFSYGFPFKKYKNDIINNFQFYLE